MNKKYLRKDLENFKVYEPENGDYNIKLDANENPYQHPNKVKEKILLALNDSSLLTRYPDTNVTQLTQKLSDYLMLNSNCVVCGVGSDQLIDTILRVTLEPKDKVLIPTPSFSMYKHSTLLNHGEAIEFELNKDTFEYEIDKILKYEKKYNPKVIFLCTPNNPTANIINRSDIESLLKSVNCLIVVDEAYSEFCNESSKSLIDKYDNIIILRTFSKAYGLAGLRIGYAISNSDNIQMIKLGLPPYHLNSLSQTIGEIILDYIDSYQIDVHNIICERKRLIDTIKDFNIIEKIYPSQTNFILVKSYIHDLAKQLLNADAKILVRDFSKVNTLKGCIRISIGTEEENNTLINVLQQINDKYSI